MKNEPNTKGIILVEVPHQLPVKSYSFSDADEFMAWLRKVASPGFSWQKFNSPAEWLSYLAENGVEPDDLTDVARQGIELFNSGAASIVEYCFSTEVKIEEVGAAPTEYGALFHAVCHDNHGAYVLTHDNWLEFKVGTFSMFQHQQLEACAAIRREAEALGWFKEYEDYTVKISTEPSYYGTDCTDEQAVEIVKSLSELIKSNFPGINTELFRDGQTSSKTTGPKESVCDDINEWIADNWTAAL